MCPKIVLDTKLKKNVDYILKYLFLKRRLVQYVCTFLFCFSAWRFKAPQLVTFVDNLTEIVISQLPNFWKLWISYVNGSLFSEVNTDARNLEFLQS